ncbi:MAG TPA: BamA/TamA family outer membrane protein [Bryobacteraceae bacterium]|jgi:outer membrane protein assembly complex protein YaeT|nr:BamA/TamA family outer membrane protein [Bryobacteraceae bacterium]
MRKVRLTFARYFCAILLPVVSSTVLFAQPQKFEGEPILTIQFDPPHQPLDAAQLHDILPLKQGEPLHMSDVRASIERLFATGRYQDIQVDAEPYTAGATAGVVIRFITTNSWFIGAVTAAGNIDAPPRANQLESAADLDLGQPFNDSRMHDAAAAQKRLMDSNGLFLSRIAPSFTYNNSYQEINIRFEVTSGPRARFSTPVLAGDVKLDPQKILKATKFRRWLIHSWKPMTQTRVSEGLASVRGLFQRENRLEARVSLESMKYNPDTNTALPTLLIEAGPRILVNAIGAKISKGQLQHYVPIFEEHSVDDDLLLEGAHNLRDYLQSEGYFEAQVEYKRQRVENDQATIDYLINPGPRHKLDAIEISGNRYFSTDEIRERLYMQKATWLQFPHGRYSESLLRRDSDAIENLYQSNGFLAVQVNTRIQDNYRGKAGELAVFLQINEGPQSFVDSLQVQGIEHLDLSKVQGSLSSIKGQPFSEFSVAVDRDTILAQYFDKGFAGATFEWNSQPSGLPNHVDLRYIIHEGTQQFVRQVLVNGLKYTRPELVDRKLTINPGDPLSPTQVTETQRKLYDLGVFARVDEAIQNPEGDTTEKYVLYQLDEARRYSVAFGVGAELGRIGGCNDCLDAATGASGFYPRISIDLARNNLWGLAHNISLRTQFSTLEQRALLNYSWPHFGDNDKLTLSFTGLFDNSKDIRTYNYTRLEGAVQLSQRLTKATTLLYRAAYRRVSVSDLKVTPFLVSTLSQSDRVGITSINLVQDRRDDPVDPHSGVYNTVDFGLAEHIFGSTRDFTRVLARNASYYAIGKRLVLARSTEVGNISVFHYHGNPADELPLPERFFGGGDSHRGFPEYQAGPRDGLTGFPLGGNALFFNQVELRFPLIGDSLGGVLFHDMGNIYSSFDHFSFRVHQQNLQDFNYMVHAVGFGIRYRTPVGPLRVDLAYSINPPYFNGFNGTLEQLLNAGVTPCPAPSGAPYQCNVQNVSHFQYFFSIGQTF